MDIKCSTSVQLHTQANSEINHHTHYNHITKGMPKVGWQSPFSTNIGQFRRTKAQLSLLTHQPLLNSYRNRQFGGRTQPVSRKPLSWTHQIWHKLHPWRSTLEQMRSPKNPKPNLQALSSHAMLSREKQHWVRCHRRSRNEPRLSPGDNNPSDKEGDVDTPSRSENDTHGSRCHRHGPKTSELIVTLASPGTHRNTCIRGPFRRSLHLYCSSWRGLFNVALKPSIWLHQAHSNLCGSSLRWHFWCEHLPPIFFL
jgi:hypothetical protein